MTSSGACVSRSTKYVLIQWWLGPPGLLVARQRTGTSARLSPSGERSRPASLPGWRRTRCMRW